MCESVMFNNKSGVCSTVIRQLLSPVLWAVVSAVVLLRPGQDSVAA
uniref:Uncharacterized protein n=1 Tax=Anguilla anguilla TaxID=7936 RepID=A0A0E9SE93_ANGAN